MSDSEQPDISDLLLPFEQKQITGDYRKYFMIKRNNFFSTIQKFPGLWEMFCRLDEIWRREIGDLDVATKIEKAAPLTLYINAHAKMRISMELGFSTCMQEARSVLRDAVEYVAHAHHMVRDPANVKIWFEKDNPGGGPAFKKAFESHKRTGLFKGAEELYEKYGELSESGSHPTLQSFHNRITLRTKGDNRGFTVGYTGVRDERSFVLELFSRLLTCFTMEQTFYQDYQGRLVFDDRLRKMREDLEAFKEGLRQTLISQYDVKPPVDPTMKP